MTSTDTIEISLRAALVAKAVLELVNTRSRLHASLAIQDVIDQLKELNEKIDKLPKD